MGYGEQIQIGTEEEEEREVEPQRPAPEHLFVCRDCQESGEEPLTVAVQYCARVEHVLEFCEHTGAYRLVRTIGELDEGVELFCCTCGFDVPTTVDEQDAIAKAAGVINTQGRVSIRCDHTTGEVEIIF